MINLRSLSDLFSAASKLAAAFIFMTAIVTSAAGQTNTFPSSGNAGVGTTSPSVLLEVNKSQNAQTNLHVLNGTNNTAAAALVLFGEQASDGHYSYVGHFSRSFSPGGAAFAEPGSFAMFGGSDGNVNVATNNNKKFQVWTTPDNGANWAVRFAVDGVGNVGVGTTGPNYKLDVATSSSNTQIRFGSTTSDSGGYLISTIPDQAVLAGGASWNGSNVIAKAATSALIAANYNAATGIQFFTNSGLTAGNSFTPTERMRIDNSGNVGIGTASPLYRFVIEGAAQTPSSSSGTGLAFGVDSTYKWIQSYNSHPLFINPLGNNLVLNRDAGNVGIGTTNPTKKLHVAGDIQVDGNINAKYQDLAEWVPSSEQLSAGTVVVLDTTKSNQVISSGTAYDTRVAGVISAQPGITLGEGGEGKVLVATTGRVRVKVDATRGAIQIGDLLVTSDVLGVAMKSEAVNLGNVQIHRPGTIIGKALEPLAKGSGEILVLLSLQ